MKIENDPHLKMPKKILDHHPHAAFPQHGTIRKAPSHMMEKIHNPRKKHAD